MSDLQEFECNFLLFPIAVPQCCLIVVRISEWYCWQNCKNCLLAFSSVTSIFDMTYNNVVVTWYYSSLWLAATCQDVDLLWSFDLLWICCEFALDLLYSLLCNKSTTNRISGVWALGTTFVAFVLLTYLDCYTCWYTHTHTRYLLLVCNHCVVLILQCDIRRN